MMAPPGQRPWPQIREELGLYTAPTDRDGSPTWTIHDPARNAYFQIDWLSFEVISRISLGSVEAICESINSDTTLEVDENAVNAVFTFLNENELLLRSGEQDLNWLSQRAAMRKKDWFQSILHGYLFFRVPLVKPDRFLGWLLPHVSFLLSSRFFKITAVIFIVGLWQIYRQWGTFSTAFVDTFTFAGILGYAGALIAVKIIHELGHAIVAKRCGCKVPTMGVAFLVMFPMAYTDVTESWKLDSHRKRLQIAGAGISTELIIAAWALWLWGFLPDGAVRNACFFLGTTSIVATLLLNASPFMRFDGYFLLCDFLGMPNLHQRSFAYARWWLREQLFKLGEAPPETLTPDQHRFFIIFAIATWIYRLILFIGIAVMVYTYFFKALGIALFIVEMWYFVLKPISQELRLWQKQWDRIGPAFRQKPAFYVSLIIILILVVPFDITVNTQGMLKPEKSFTMITSVPVQLRALPPPLGSKVEAGTLIIGLESPELNKKIAQTQARIDSLTFQVAASGFDPQLRNQQAILREQLQLNQESLDGFVKEKVRLNPRAQYSGVIADANPDLFVGEWLPKGSQLVTLVDDRQWVVDCYVTETDLKRLDKGNWGKFIPEGRGLWGSSLSIISIDRDATRTLVDGALASTAGGDIVVRLQEKRSIPEQAIYRVRLKVDGWSPLTSEGYLRGNVVIYAWPKSILGDFIRSILVTLLREVGF
jgi:putative peptide zinc metalloprotease protein